MDSEEKIGFLLTPKVQALVIQIMDDLVADGIEPTNEILIRVLKELSKYGKILQLDAKDLRETMEKIVPEGGKVLHIKEDHLTCQECGAWITEETAVKVHGEGFVCSLCCDRWILGEDDDTLSKEDN